MEPDDGAKTEFKFTKACLFSLIKLQLRQENIWISKIIPRVALLKSGFLKRTFSITQSFSNHSHPSGKGRYQKSDVGKQRSGHNSSDILLFWRPYFNAGSDCRALVKKKKKKVNEKQKQPTLLPSAVSVSICTGKWRHLLRDFPSAGGPLRPQ